MKLIRLLSFLILSILFTTCSNQQKNSDRAELTVSLDENGIIHINRLPAINDLIPKIFEQIAHEKNLSSSGSIDHTVTVECKGINYSISWNDENRINYLSTTDENFKTEEGVSINRTLKEVQKIQKLQILKDVGWGYYGELNSGWNVGFCVDESCTGRDILETDKVNWIFKR